MYKTPGFEPKVMDSMQDKNPPAKRPTKTQNLI
jgi:hypothetical protein